MYGGYGTCADQQAVLVPVRSTHVRWIRYLGGTTGSAGTGKERSCTEDTVPGRNNRQCLHR